MTSHPCSYKLRRELREWRDVWLDRLARELADMLKDDSHDAR